MMKISQTTSSAYPVPARICSPSGPVRQLRADS